MTEKETQFGSRNPHFVTIRRGGLLDDARHRLLTAWAADCAEHVLHLFSAESPKDKRVENAIKQARAWSRGEISIAEAREAAFAAHDAVKSVDGAARDAARAAGHAVATAHMADHELGAAAYAIRAARAAAAEEDRDETGYAECQWQRQKLPEAIRELVLEDEHLRNKKLWSLFE